MPKFSKQRGGKVELRKERWRGEGQKKESFVQFLQKYLLHAHCVLGTDLDSENVEMQ